jgi:hypothetical protein
VTVSFPADNSFLFPWIVRDKVPRSCSREPVLPSGDLYLHLGAAHDWRDPFEVGTGGAELSQARHVGRTARQSTSSENPTKRQLLQRYCLTIGFVSAHAKSWNHDGQGDGQFA